MKNDLEAAVRDCTLPRNLTKNFQKMASIALVLGLAFGFSACGRASETRSALTQAPANDVLITGEKPAVSVEPSLTPELQTAGSPDVPAGSAPTASGPSTPSFGQSAFPSEPIALTSPETPKPADSPANAAPPSSASAPTTTTPRATTPKIRLAVLNSTQLLSGSGIPTWSITSTFKMTFTDGSNEQVTRSVKTSEFPTGIENIARWNVQSSKHPEISTVVWIKFTVETNPSRILYCSGFN